MSDSRNAPRIVVRILRVLFGALCLGWLAAGLADGSTIDALRAAAALYPSGPQRTLWEVCAWTVAGVGALELLSPLLGLRLAVLRAIAAPDNVVGLLVDTLGATAVLALCAMHALVRAASPAYFSELAPLDYATAGACLAFHAWSLARLIRLASRTNPAYREYVEYRRQTGRRSEVEKRQRRSRESLAVHGAGIRTKLVLSFVTLVLAVIAILAAVLMAAFRGTILESVIDNGRSVTDRAASVIKANLGDEIAIADYFEIERFKNGQASLPFRSLSFYGRRASGGLPTVVASTEPSLLGRPLPENYAGSAAPLHQYAAERRAFEFLAPVMLSNVLVGYVLASYDPDRIYEPYFRTQVRVVLIAGLFVYVAVFAVYLFGARIVFPILSLRTSVARISATLADMIAGRTRVSPELLHYEDRVPTRDEIKGLSAEIGNMTTVIRGIIPYISASTLKQADRARPSSQRRELAFLFTDIRGFTTLCEGMQAEAVVEILNHYLDLQTEIILRHHGDIDKFVGDEIMGVFDGPTRELNACRAAMEIRTAMAKDHELKEEQKRALISIGIGINSGPVVFGSVGARNRMDFTSIGDTVNLAARVEGANKTYGTKALITESVYEKVKDAFLCREIDLLTVKGKSQPVRIYEILQERSKASPALATLAESFGRALAHYRQRQWDQAAQLFGALAEKMHDEPSRVFLKRIEMYRASPPPRGWDGVFELTVK